MPVQTPPSLLNTNTNSQTNTSFLSYASSNQFRENLLLLNLQPYNIDGINPENAGSVTYQQTLPDLANPEVLFSLDNPDYPAIFRNDNPDAKIIPSTYTAYDILTTTYPTGSNGSITQDSYLAKIGSQVLKSLLSDTNAKYLELQVQAQNSVSFNITTPDVNETFESKLQGSYFPKSTIPGDYFLDGLNSRPTDTLGEVINLAAGRSTIVGGLFNGTLTRGFSPSQLFLQNTSDGQKGVLFSNLSYNIYRPAYANSTLGGLAGNLLTTFANNLLDNFGLQLPGAFYVGSVTSDPLFAASPINAVPIDVFGRATGAPVFGPDVLAKDYEGNEGKLNFGLQNKNLIDQGNVEGNFIWVSPKYKEGNEEYYSTNIDFKPGSILDDTQRLINAADNLQGDSRLRHVGTAMNQISKIFDDGYKKITKGSKVATYKDSLFEKVIGEEYCRVFTKVDAYTTYDKLQKSEGIVNYGRRFDNSVLDNTFNLNIAPLKGENSTNILREGSVKKYMFSLENLAWASNNDLFNDLPACEKGPNGGRIMWFPPYGLTFNDNSSAQWNETKFLGRPEPVYTYQNTSRNGTLNWKIVVDHPSVLNVIVNKVLSNETPFNANRALEAFFAGCQKYDLYDLASKYSTIDRNSLQEIQKIVKTTPAVYKDVENIIPKNVTTLESVNKIENVQSQAADLSSFVGLGFYFDNNKPGPNTGVESSGPFNQFYEDYLSKQEEYKNKALNDKDQVFSFFDNVIKYNFDTIKGEFFTQLYEALNNGNEIVIQFEGSASASASDDYNKKLSTRRINSVEKFLKEYSLGSNNDVRSLSKFIGKELKITKEAVGESAKNVSPKSNGGNFAKVSDCTTNPLIKDGPQTGKKMTDTQAIYTTESMACRSVRIKEIIVTPPRPTQKQSTLIEEKTKTYQETVIEREKVQDSTVEETTKILDKPGLSKRVLRFLLNECDYFEVLKETDPFVYDELRKKLKFFNPTFHSITPEGLNSRLTFLNQCLRPGKTIPVIGTDGELKNDDSLNTAFGTPPVLVLRIGDFFNTKIIPKTLGLTFENGNGIQYDMNPEGIGLQPLVANVQLSFDFIGGQGLANPVDELQNALSFNYYANTEIYDERATSTENVSDLDVLIDFNKQLPAEQPQPILENIPQNSQGKTIGNIVSNILGKSSQTFSETEETGKFSYRDLMSSILDQSRDYFSAVINKSTSISETYNSIITLLSTSKRKYENGVVGTGSTTIFGYCFDVQNQINSLINSVKEDIASNNNTILKFYIDKGFLEDGPVLTTIKTNMTNFIENLKQDFVNGIVQELEFVNTQEITLISSIDQMNVVYSAIDGKVTNKGDVIIYDISGSSSGDLYSDYNLLSSEYTEFLSFMYSQGLITDTQTPNFDITTYPFEIFTQDWEKRFFALMCHIIVDKNKLEQFKNALLPDGDVIGGNEITKPKRPTRVMETILGLRLYQELNFSLGSDMHDKFSREKRRQNRKYINLPLTSAIKYNKYTRFFNPYNKLSNKRILDYISKPSPTDDEKNKILNLWSTQYNGNQDSFNGKKKFN